MREYRIKIREGETWWLGVSAEGVHMPITADSSYSFSLLPDHSANQTTAALLSDQGSYVYCKDGFDLKADRGVLTIVSPNGVEHDCGGSDLRSAFLRLSGRHFPVSAKIPPEEFFSYPQFNTWIEYTYFLTQKKVLEYAENIRTGGIGCKLLIIDCGWASYYGSFEFSAAFPEPKKMVDTLHEMGFKVMLWVCPFIGADSVEFRALRDADMLVKNQDGKPAIREWWDGYSAVLDLTNPASEHWLCDKLDRLMREYGVDGFKFDAGDCIYYRDDDIIWSKGNAYSSSRAWAKLGLRYEYNEFRYSFDMGGKPLVQRLKDKNHTFGENGLGALVPATLMQNLFGYYYTCPDMIGGGDYKALNDSTEIDEELIVRYSQCSALMPMMQFSIAPWRVLSKENYGRILRSVQLHESLVPYYMEQIRGMQEKAEPIVRLLEYNYPASGYGEVMDVFMIGDRYLCAPVLKKGEKERAIPLPRGKWKYNGSAVEGGRTIRIPVDLDSIPLFERVLD